MKAVSGVMLPSVILHTYTKQPYITWGNGDTDGISRLSSPLRMLLLGPWNLIFSGFASSHLFYKTLQNVRILSWFSDCVWEHAFPASCFFFLFKYSPCIVLFHYLQLFIASVCYHCRLFSSSSPVLSLFLLFASLILFLCFSFACCSPVFMSLASHKAIL